MQEFKTYSSKFFGAEQRFKQRSVPDLRDIEKDIQEFKFDVKTDQVQWFCKQIYADQATGKLYMEAKRAM